MLDSEKPLIECVSSQARCDSQRDKLWAGQLQDKRKLQWEELK